MARLLGWVNAALTVVVLAAAAGAGLSLLGGRVPVLDVASHFAPVYAAVAAAGLAWAVLAGRGPVMALAVLGLVASGVLIVPEFRRETGPVPAAGSPSEIKIVQFNAFRRNVDIPRVLAWMTAQAPDIVTLQEAQPDLRDALAHRTGWSVVEGPDHVMILSREEPLPDGPRLSGGGPMGYVGATYPSASGPFTVVTTRLDWPTKPVHARQQAALAALARRLPRERLIVAGDFNATPWSASLRRADRELGLLRRDRALFSFPTRFLVDGPPAILPIDHVYAGPGWATVRVERGPSLGSDHYPVVVTLAPAAPR